MASQIEKLKQHLMPGETIIMNDMVGVGSYSGPIVLTNKRVFISVRGVLAGGEISSYPLDQISSLNLNTSFFGAANIILGTSSDNIEIAFFSGKKKATQFLDAIKAQIASYKEELNSPSLDNNSSSEDVYEQLRKLAELKDAGILSEEEFNEKKKKLLDKIN